MVVLLRNKSPAGRRRRTLHWRLGRRPGWHRPGDPKLCGPASRPGCRFVKRGMRG